MLLADEITTGELGRRITALEDTIGRRQDKFEVTVSSQFDRMSHQITGLQFIHRDTYDAHRASDLARLDELEEGRRWLNRLVAGSIVVPILVLIIGIWITATLR
jgi:hypothetical protein